MSFRYCIPAQSTYDHASFNVVLPHLVNLYPRVGALMPATKRGVLTKRCHSLSKCQPSELNHTILPRDVVLEDSTSTDVIPLSRWRPSGRNSSVSGHTSRISVVFTLTNLFVASGLVKHNDHGRVSHMPWNTIRRT